MLKWIDDIGVYPREKNGPTPFLLLDGHGYRLELPFLQYVNDPAHKWIVCIGVPNGTSVWQVGDSNEQNGSYKMYCSQYKKMITSKRFTMGIFKLNLTRTDIIPIVNFAWEKSFNRVDTNLKAIRERGWGPLNRLLLTHPEIISSKPSPAITSSLPRSTEPNIDTNIATPSPPAAPKNTNKVHIEDINFKTGYAGEVIRSILRKAQRDEQILKNIDLSNKIGTDFLSSMETAKKWSAGIIFKSGKCYLDKDVLSMVIKAKEKKNEQLVARVKKINGEYCEKKQEYEIAVCEMKKWEMKTERKREKLPLKILKPLCAYKKRKGDKAIPTKQDGLLERWMSTKHRGDMTLEEWIKSTTLIETYKKDTGRELTMGIVNTILSGDNTEDQPTIPINGIITGRGSAAVVTNCSV